MAPSKRARIEQENSTPSIPKNPATKETPLSVGTCFIRTACLSLSTSFGTTLPFLSNFASKNLKMFQEIKQKESTIENLKTSGKYARSIRFKFKLETSAKLLNTDKHKELEAKTKEPLETCQKAFQDIITESREYELTMLQEEKAEHCLRFLCFLVKTYRILKPEMRTCIPIRAVDFAVENPSIKELFLPLDEDKSRTFMCAFFNEDKATVFEQDLNQVTIAVSKILVQETYKLFLLPQTKYIERQKDLEAIKEAQALSTFAITGDITEKTAAAMDTVASTTPEQLKELIDRKVAEKTKALTDALKNYSGGANSASLKKKKKKKATKRGNHSGSKNSDQKESPNSPKKNKTTSTSKKPSNKSTGNKKQADEGNKDSKNNMKETDKESSNKKKVRFSGFSDKPKKKQNRK